MDKYLRYHQKHVHDISVEDSFIRLWDARGTPNIQVIKKAYQPLLKTSFVYPYIALMPDYHPGEGSMIGSVIPTKKVILPSVIGGDLGCGMMAVQLPLHVGAISPKFHEIQKVVKERIPVGTAHNAVVTKRVEQNSIWKRNTRALIITNQLRRKMLRQFGSLGGGNHFLEIQKDQEGQVWVMIHSGSRYLGVKIRDYYIEKGKDQEGIDPKLYSKIPYLKAGTEIAYNYLSDLQFAMDFARENRKEMMLRVLEVFSMYFLELEHFGGLNLINTAYDIAHNYIAEEEFFGEKIFIHRKGAIRIRKAEIGLIPGSMGTKSYIVEGRGNEFSFCSCSHGAGRSMPRGEAFRKISSKDFRKSMGNIIYEHDDRIRDEAPIAYKDIQQVMRSQSDLVIIRHILQPLVSIKGR